MTRSALFAGVTATALIAAGCATAPTPAPERTTDVFQESAADVVNRAPQSMSVPTQAGSDGVLDQLQVRSQADYHFTLGESYALEGNNARAIEEYKLTLVYDPSSVQVRLRLAAEYVKQGLISEAMEQTKTALEYDAKHVEAHLLLGGLYSALRVYDEAIAEYKKVLELSPENLEAPMFIGALLAEQKKYGEALTQFEKLAKDPNNTNAHLAWYYLGRIRLEENKPGAGPKAEAAYQRALASKPTHVDSLLALGQLYETSGRKPQALELYRAFQEKHGPNATVAEELARFYVDAKDYQHAYEQFAVMESSDPDDLNPKVKMAFILIEQQKFEQAIYRLEDILARAPTSDKIRFYLGAVYEEIKDYKSAIGHFQKVPIVSTYYKEAVIHTSYLYKLLGDYDNALKAIRAGIDAQDDHAPFYALYASLLDDQKSYKAANEMLEGAVKKFPENAQLRFFLGSMQDKLGKKEETVKSMQAVLELEKDHVQALNYLAYTYADQGQNLQEAERMVRRAAELQPNDGYILDTLGWVLFKKGSTSEAIRTLEAAYKLQPDESVIAEHLADAYYHQQMPEKAKKLYMRAAENESNVATVEKIRAKIIDVDRQIQTFGSDGGRKPASARTPTNP